MQAELVELALEHGSSVLADHLKSSAKAHGSAKLTAVTLKMVEQAALLVVAKPEPTHGVGMWFRPLVARRLKDAGIGTLAELVDFCNHRGGSWWRAVPRIGPGCMRPNSDCMSSRTSCWTIPCARPRRRLSRSIRIRAPSYPLNA